MNTAGDPARHRPACRTLARTGSHRHCHQRSPAGARSTPIDMTEIRQTETNWPRTSSQKRCVATRATCGGPRHHKKSATRLESPSPTSNWRASRIKLGLFGQSHLRADHCAQRSICRFAQGVRFKAARFTPPDSRCSTQGARQTHTLAPNGHTTSTDNDLQDRDTTNQNHTTA